MSTIIPSASAIPNPLPAGQHIANRDALGRYTFRRYTEPLTDFDREAARIIRDALTAGGITVDDLPRFFTRIGPAEAHARWDDGRFGVDILCVLCEIAGVDFEELLRSMPWYKNGRVR